MKTMINTTIRTLAVIGAVTLAPAAMAADAIVDIPQPPLAEPAPIFTWTGAYIGAQAGYSDFVADDNPVAGRDVDIDGFVGGVHAGYNYQFDNGTGRGFVVGAYVDIDFGQLDIDLEGRTGAPNAINGVGEIDYIARGMAKAGYGFGRVLGYVQGGVNYADGSVSVNPALIPSLAEPDGDIDGFGYSVGAGIDVAVTDNIVVGADYLFEDFGSGGLVPLRRRDDRHDQQRLRSTSTATRSAPRSATSSSTAFRVQVPGGGADGAAPFSLRVGNARSGSSAWPHFGHRGLRPARPDLRRFPLCLQ